MSRWQRTPQKTSLPLPSVTIHVARGRSSTTSREMKGRSLLLGSGPQCDIQMRSPDVAPKHALITRGTDGVVIRPLDAEHPVLVNGSVANEQQLSHGDSIKLGPFELRITIQDSIPHAGSPKSSSASSAWQSLARLTKRQESEPAPAFVPSDWRRFSGHKRKPTKSWNAGVDNCKTNSPRSNQSDPSSSKRRIASTLIAKRSTVSFGNRPLAKRNWLGWPRISRIGNGESSNWNSNSN